MDIRKLFKESNVSEEHRIGVAGFSNEDQFDIDEAKKIIEKAFDSVNSDKKIVVVSGLSNVGIPKLAHEEAKKRGWKSVGLSAKEVKEYECYEADEEIIVGDKFGDESEKFIDYIDELMTFGGGEQTKKEIKMAKDKKLKVTEHTLGDEIPGGLGDDKTAQDIADKFDVSIEDVEKEIEMGIEVEFEHTDDKDKAKEIAIDHLMEFPDYYTRLDKMEEEGEAEWEETVSG